MTDLSIRAGTPPTPGELLKRAQLTGFLYDMDTLWDSWMGWFTEVQETHTSYGSLVYFRSPHPHRSWVTAAGAILDTAAIRMALIDIPWTPNAPLMIRSGYLALREVVGFFGFDYDDDPPSDGAISVARDEFDELCKQLARGGRAAARRQGSGVEGLRRLARQLRRDAHHAGCVGVGSVRAVGFGSIAGEAAGTARVRPPSAGDNPPGGSTLSSQARNRSTPAMVCIVRIELYTSNAWCAPRSST